MENLTYHQQRILNQLFSPLVKTDPLEELERIIKFYYHVLKHEDVIIINYFKKSVEAKLTLILPSYFMFYQFDHYKEKYLEELYDHIKHSPDSIEIDFIDKCIFEQEGILNSSPEFYVQVDDDNSINAMQFVSENFLDEFKISSKRKIEFLQDKQRVTLAIQSNNIIIEYENPYPDYFKSYGYELFNIFLEEDLANNNLILAKASFLVNELRKDSLMSNDFSLKKIFDFFIETFDLNLGKATKFKTDFSREKYIEPYKLMKSNY